MSDSKLLSEQELRGHLEDFIYDILVDTPDGRERKKVVDLDEVLNVIKSQKIAHADMVIGNDKKSERWNELFPEDKGSGRDVDEMTNINREELRDEQRKRNKV